MKTGATLARGKSKQDYQTPTDFLIAVEKRFGLLTCDLAATAENTAAPIFIGPPENSLVQPWREHHGLLWLNPPFDRIEPWAHKCHEEAPSGPRILFLTPASVGSNWFASHIFGRALVLFLSPRLQFVGATDPYPKDLMLSCFGYVPGFECWRWK